jgi:hypothetical protein
LDERNFLTETKNTNTNLQAMNILFKSLRILAAYFISLGSLAGVANGALVISIKEAGGSVSVTTSGSVDTSGMTRIGVGGFSGPQGLINGATHAFGDSLAYGLASSFGNTNAVFLATLSPFGILPATASSIPFSPDIPGMEVGYLPGFSQVVLPSDYSSGSAINYSVTLSGGNGFSDFGFTPGETWGVRFSTASATDSITFTVVPEPPSGFLLGLGALVLVLRRTRFQSNASRGPGRCARVVRP